MELSVNLWHLNNTWILFSNFWKNMIKTPLIWLIYLTLWANFGIKLGLMKSNDCVAFANILHINLQKCQNLCQWVDVNSIWSLKNLWKYTFRASMKVSFSYFPNTALDRGRWNPIPFRIFVDHLTMLAQALCNI